MGYRSSLKVRLARAQLGTATELFIRDKDPLSVHALACGACELLEGAAETAGFSTLSTHILETHPELNIAKIKAIRNQHWNALKHYYAHDRRTERDDASLMMTFSDSQNDTPLFMGWFDYMQVTKMLPIPVQVFQVWWYALNADKLAPAADREAITSLFPNIVRENRSEQKRKLRRAIDKYKNSRELLMDPRSERAPLMLSREPRQTSAAPL